MTKIIKFLIDFFNKPKHSLAHLPKNLQREWSEDEVRRVALHIQMATRKA